MADHIQAVTFPAPVLAVVMASRNDGDTDDMGRLVALGWLGK